MIKATLMNTVSPAFAAAELLALRTRVAALEAMLAGAHPSAHWQHIAERYQAFLQHSVEGVWCFDVTPPMPVDSSEDTQIDWCYAHGFLAECNPAMAQMYGFDDPHAIIGAPLGDFVPRGDPRNEAYMRNFIRSNYRIIDAESYEFDREGTPKVFLNNLTGIVADGHLLRAWGTQRDITARVRDERALALLSELSAALGELLDGKAIAEVVPPLLGPAFGGWCSMDVVREDGSLEHHPVFHADPLKQQLAMRLLETLPTDDDARRDPVIAIMQAGKPVFGMLTDVMQFIYTPAGYEAVMAMGVNAFICMPMLARGRVIGVLSVGRTEPRPYDDKDITLLQTIASRVAVALDNARLLRERQRAVEIRDQFMVIAAHELRTPTTAIVGFSQLLHRYLLHNAGSGERTLHMAKMLVTQTHRLERLIATVLDVTRLQGGPLALQRTRLDVVALVSDMIAEITPTLAIHRIEATLPTTVMLVYGDRLRLEQVLYNLLSNAVKYMPQGGNIDVLVASVPGFAAIQVRDAGVGIAPEALREIGTLFYRSVEAKALVSGLGVGLYVVYEIMALHGGSVVITSEWGRGTTVELRLPMLPEA